MLLLSDGTVLAKSFSGGSDGIGNIYDRLTPDIHGSYANGTWSTISAMIDTRLYYSSQVLMDGRLVQDASKALHGIDPDLPTADRIKQALKETTK